MIYGSDISWSEENNFVGEAYASQNMQCILNFKIISNVAIFIFYTSKFELFCVS